MASLGVPTSPMYSRVPGSVKASAASHGSVNKPLQVADITLPQQQVDVESGSNSKVKIERSVVRLGLPSKGRMAEGTLNLLNECSLPVRKRNPRQYIADILGMDNLEVWFQRESDIVRKIRDGILDMGILSYDVVAELGEDDPDLIVVHEALGFGQCYLAIAVPTCGVFESITSVSELAAMAQWTAKNPLRICTGFIHVGAKFLQQMGLKHVVLSTADGALEAAPAMGIADAILDLVSSGVTLRENDLKELAGGRVLTSEGVFVASKRALLGKETVLNTARELLERLEAHLRARGQCNVVADILGSSEQEVAQRLSKHTNLAGVHISPVYTSEDGAAKVEAFYAVSICVGKPHLYDTVRQLRSAGGSGVLVTPVSYIFDAELPRWRQLLETLNLS